MEKKPNFDENLQNNENVENEDAKSEETTDSYPKKPVIPGGITKGWYWIKELVDVNGDVFKKGKYVGNISEIGFDNLSADVVDYYSLDPEETQRKRAESLKAKQKDKPKKETKAKKAKKAEEAKQKPKNSEQFEKQDKIDSKQAALDAAIEAKKSLIAKQRELAKLEKEAREYEEMQDKLMGIIKRQGFKFTPEEIEYLSQYNADVEKNIFYICSLTDDCPKAYISVAGQSFENSVYTRKDGWCPKCSQAEATKNRAKKRKIRRLPKYVGELTPSCPVCGTPLVFDNANYRDVEMPQHYPGFYSGDRSEPYDPEMFRGISGDLVFLIAMHAHKKLIDTPQYDTVARKDLPPILVPAIEYIRMEWIKLTDTGQIELAREVDLRSIYKHYYATAEVDGSGNILKEGEKKIFFYSSSRVENRDLLPDFEEAEC